MDWRLPMAISSSVTDFGCRVKKRRRPAHGICRGQSSPACSMRRNAAAVSSTSRSLSTSTPSEMDDDDAEMPSSQATESISNTSVTLQLLPDIDAEELRSRRSSQLETSSAVLADVVVVDDAVAALVVVVATVVDETQ